MGGELFLRDRAGCSLTPLGTIIFPYLKEVMRQTNKAMADAQSYVRLEGVPISVGVGETIGQSRIANAIARHHARVPNVNIEVIVASQNKLFQGLREGRFDIIVINSSASPDLYKIEPLYSEDYRVVVSSTHPLSQRKTVKLDMLANNKMLARVNCEMRDVLYSVCADKGNSLNFDLRSNSIDWLLELVRMGEGFLILPDTAIPKTGEFVSLAIEDINIQRQVFALRYLHQSTRPEARGFIQELTKRIPLDECCI